MKVLIIPMAAMAETSGPFSRTILLANDLIKADIDVALCAAKDINYKPIKGVRNYDLSIPMPLGLPSFIATHTFPIAQKLGITSKKSVPSFEDVLYLTGNIDYNYLKRSVNEICNAIQEYEPDVIYSEFNISALIATKLLQKRIYISASFPTQNEYSSSPKYAKGVNRLLKELQLPTVTSSLELFSWADKKFIPSCYELEPFHDDNVIFCGSLKHRNVVSHQQKDKILVYMGNGTISQKKMVTEIKTAFQNSNYHVYIAGMGLNEEHFDTIHIAPYFDFKSLLPEALLFINHGGQNSIIDGLIYGVPQLICPGKVFERRFNAQSIEKNHAGIELSYTDFSAECILRYADKILSDSQYQNNAENLGNILVSLGGTQNIIRALRGN